MSSPSRIASAAALAMSFGVLSASAADLVPYWGRYVLDTTGEAAGPSQPQFDKDNHLKIAYRGHYDVKYVEFANGSFTTQVADTGTGGDAKLAFALDGSGNPHIAYYNSNYTQVYYAWKNGGDWKHEIVTGLHDKNYNLDWYQLCLAADSKGGAHLAYSREANNFPSMWHTYVDKDGNLSDSGFVVQDLTGKWNGIVLDSHEKPVIAFFRNLDEQMRVAWQDSGAWQTQTLSVADTSVPPPKGIHAAIVRENDTLYHALYQNKDRHEIWMATGRPGGTWTTERIDSLPGFTYFQSHDAIVMGKGGRPYVVYGRHSSADGNTVTAGSLVFAYKEDGDWKKTVVDSSGITGLYAALAVDSAGMPAITYYELGKRYVKLALGSESPIALRRPLGGKRTLRPSVSARRDVSGRKAEAKAQKARILFSAPR